MRTDLEVLTDLEREVELLREFRERMNALVGDASRSADSARIAARNAGDIGGGLSTKTAELQEETSKVLIAARAVDEGMQRVHLGLERLDQDREERREFAETWGAISKALEDLGGREA